VFEKLGGYIENFIITNFVPAFGDTIQAYLHEFSLKTSQLTVTGAIILIIIALMLLETIDSALNIIWHVQVPRRPTTRFLVYWSILTLGPLLVGAGIFLTTYVLSLAIVSDVKASLGLELQLLSWVPFLTSAIAFTLLYILLPNCVVSRRHAIIGGIVAAILFEYTKFGFGVYISSYSTYEAIYGAIAVIPVFLIWIYTSWVIVLLGAHITFCLSAFRLDFEIAGSKGPEWTFVDACDVIALLWSAQRSGMALTYAGLRKSEINLPLHQINEIMNALVEANWIQLDPKGGWLLSRDMSELTLMDLYRIIPNRIPLREESGQASTPNRPLQELLKSYNHDLNQLFGIPFKAILPTPKDPD
ncbi:MAG: ribonuclease BN, partial [Gammaproteobacteria bacterium]|nr:ribonuclease BN [Gammaproteobacteria bacterium]